MSNGFKSIEKPILENVHEFSGTLKENAADWTASTQRAFSRIQTTDENLGLETSGRGTSMA